MSLSVSSISALPYTGKYKQNADPGPRATVPNCRIKVYQYVAHLQESGEATPPSLGAQTELPLSLLGAYGWQGGA